MNKAFNKLIKGLLIVPLGFISSCDNKVDMNNIVFEDKNIIQQLEVILKLDRWKYN